MTDHPIHGSKYFDIREWVHPRTWSALGWSSQEQIDPRIVRIADLLRDLSGVPVTVNNWHYATSGIKVYRSSGHRDKKDSTGAEYSQHRLGRAADFKVQGMNAVQMLKLVTDHLPVFIDAGLTTIEDVKYTPTWLHLDCRPRRAMDDPNGIRVVEPK